MKKITLIAVLFLAVLVLSGCGTAGTDALPIVYSISTIIKTVDGGATWEASSKDNSNKTIIVPEILALEIDPANSQNLYVGTEKDGLLSSVDGGASWKRLTLSLTRIYGVEVSKGDSQVIYASGLLKERGKVFKSVNGGQDWKEVYSEPANGPMVSAMALDPKNQDVVYAGNSDGMIIKTMDGGKAWKNISKTDGPITAIDFDSGNSSTVYFMVFNGSVLRTKDGGSSLENLREKVEVAQSNGKPFSLAMDSNGSGSFYVGLGNGLLRGSNFGDKFEALNVIESSKKFPIRTVAVNPQNSKELFYSSAQAIYKSTDEGKTWSTFQLDTTRTGSQLKYDPQNTNVIYFGLRKAN